MSGKPPNDEEMEDAAWPVGAGAGPAPAANMDNQRSDNKTLVKNSLKKIRSIPYENTVEAIKNAVQELVDDEKLKAFAPDTHERFKQAVEGIFANADMSVQKFKQEVKFEAGKLENQLITEAINKNLGLGIGDLYGRGPLGGKRKTRKNKKYLRKRTNVRKTTHSSKR